MVYLMLARANGHGLFAKDELWAVRIITGENALLFAHYVPQPWPVSMKESLFFVCC